MTAGTLYEMTGFTDRHLAADHRRSSASMQGVGLGLVFVPITSVAFPTLPGHLRTDGTAILTLVRNIGSSIGISMVIAKLTSTTDEDARASDRICHAVQQRAARCRTWRQS